MFLYICTVAIVSYVSLYSSRKSLFRRKPTHLNVVQHHDKSRVIFETLDFSSQSTFDRTAQHHSEFASTYVYVYLPLKNSHKTDRKIIFSPTRDFKEQENRLETITKLYYRLGSLKIFFYRKKLTRKNVV